jgi:hypothetical protein
LQTQIEQLIHQTQTLPSELDVFDEIWLLTTWKKFL